LIGAWVVAAGAGLWRLAAYSFSPGPQGLAPADWPAQTALAREPGHFTAIIALHPECPCSKATVEELDAVMAQTGGQLRVQALFVEVPGLPGPIEQSELWQRASRIPGVELHQDAGGREARRFGAETSGETRLYGPDGRLRFHGGITAARGHAGDNPGETAMVNLITQKIFTGAPVATPVFGCELFDQPTKP
jgi:hypothetical protein